MADATITLSALDLGRRSCLHAASALRGRSVLVATRRQICVVLAMAELDGLASRIVLCPPDLAAEHLPHVIATAEIDAVVYDAADDPPATVIEGPCVALDPSALAGAPLRPSDGAAPFATEWVLFTSGTTSRPKMVVHDLVSLAAPFATATTIEQGSVWSSFYDVRRYGGLTILLRALLGGSSMVLSDPDEPVGGFLGRVAAAGVTHMSGTPSHWRRAMMSPAAANFAPRYVRLSGEVADQAILNRLAAAFAQSGIAHAFASTEAGVAFGVTDGREGFPVGLLDTPGAVELRVEDGALLIRSAATARRYLGDGPPLRRADGFVDTGDMLERNGDRYRFIGRRSGIINVGGFKVHPEEVEAVINQDPRVQMSRVRARTNAITGAVVVADIVLRGASQNNAPAVASIASDILARCRATLARHKVPVSVRSVPALEILPTGKLARHVD